LTLKIFKSSSLTTFVVVFGNQVFQHTFEILIGTNCAPLFADVFLYSHEAEFIQTLLHEKKENPSYCGLQFNILIYQQYYIYQQQAYVNFIYPGELEIQDTTESYTSILNIYILSKNRLKRETNNPIV
jgi:hypothetical protein